MWKKFDLIIEKIQIDFYFKVKKVEIKKISIYLYM